MGTIIHHSIVVASWDLSALCAAHQIAHSLGLQPSALQTGALNGYCSFFVPPDGSKEGWPESDRGNERRAQFKRWLVAFREADGSSALEWVEVAFGNDYDRL